MPAESIGYNLLYPQVKEVILKRLADGVYAPGAVIPSEQKLAADFGTSISTIRQALLILVSDGPWIKYLLEEPHSACSRSSSRMQE